MSDGFGRGVTYSCKLTQEELNDDLYRILQYAKDDENLKKMCSYCDGWHDKEHDYNECVDMPCFIFYRAFKYLEFANSFE